MLFGKHAVRKLKRAQVLLAADGFSANRRRTDSQDRLACSVSLTSSPAKGSSVQRARPVGALEQVVATNRASSLPDRDRRKITNNRMVTVRLGNEQAWQREKLGQLIQPWHFRLLGSMNP
jgi:hypothetical protein